MTKITKRASALAMAALAMGACALGASRAEAKTALDPEAIAKAGGVKAVASPDGVVKITSPRIDVAIKVDGGTLKPFAGLASWAAFTAMDHGAMVMGDNVLFQDEVDAAIDAAFAHGLNVSALHNHFFYDDPKVYFMHIGGEGNAEDLAEGVKAIWDAVKGVRAAAPQPASAFAGGFPEAGAINADAVEKIVGIKPAAQDGVVKVTTGKTGKMHGVEVGVTMGLYTWAAFSGSDAAAVADGDFIMTAPEIGPTLRALRKAGFHIVALHSHMAGEEPACYFTHFWGKGSVEELAKGLKSALDAQAAVKPAEGKQ